MILRATPTFQTTAQCNEKSVKVLVEDNSILAIARFQTIAQSNEASGDYPIEDD